MKPIREHELSRALLDAVAWTTNAESTAADGSDECDAAREDEPGKNGFRILLAEDNDINRFVATEVLDAGGYQWTVVVNGAEAVEATNDPGIRSGSHGLDDAGDGRRRGHQGDSASRIRAGRALPIRKRDSDRGPHRERAEERSRPLPNSPLKKSFRPKAGASARSLRR